MKKLIFLIALSMLVVGCSKNKDVNNNLSIVIKGSISASGKANGAKVKSQSSSLAGAAKVLVYSNNYYKLYNIVNGSFTVEGQPGTGVALIFLDENNKYIGNLSARGLNVLPLGYLSDGDNTTIDLSTLSLSGTNVIPSHDPFSKEIIMSNDDIAYLQAASGFYESIAKNIDTDNDGVPDILTDSRLNMFTNYQIFAGHWGLNNSKEIFADSAHMEVNYVIQMDCGKALTYSKNTISLSGPVGDPYNDIENRNYYVTPNGFQTSFDRPLDLYTSHAGTIFRPFKDGTYTLTMDGIKMYTLYYNCIDIKYNLIMVVPTMHTNSDGKLNSLTFEYKLPNGTVISPDNVLTNVMVQFFNNNFTPVYLTENGKLTIKTGFSEIIPSTPIDISSLSQINIEYDDFLGNHYNILWE